MAMAMQAKEEILVPSDLIKENKKEEILLGIRAGIPIAIGYIPIAIAFGLLAKASGIPNYVSIMMSFFVFAGASQFMGVGLIALGTGFAEIVLTTFILNLRHFLMSTSLFHRIESTSNKALLSIMSFGITDETFSVASLQKREKLTIYFLLALNFLAFAAWNAGTWVGLFLAEGMPQALKNSMGISLYAMFIGLLIPSLKKSLPILVTAAVAAMIHGFLSWLPIFSSISTGWSIILSTIAGALAGSIFFPKGVNNNE
jgi:4-azaleucine resistance transporter AzlC